MKLTKLFLSLASVAALMVGAGAPAFAGTATDHMAVSANVANQCVVSAGSLAFGAYQFDANKDGQATLTLTCTPGTATTVTLDLGLHPSGSPASQRNMSNGTDSLMYNLYSDAAGGTAWPTTGVTGPVGGSGTVTVYGRIPANQNKPTGSYTDSVLASVNF